MHAEAVPVGEAAPPVSGEQQAVPTAGASVADAVSAEMQGGEEPRVLMRLGFNKVLYSTDIHPNGYKPPGPGETVRGHPKVSLEKQLVICVVVTLVVLVGTFAVLVPADDDDSGVDDENGHGWRARDCSAAHHAAQRGGFELGGNAIPTSDTEVQNAIGIPVSQTGRAADDDGDDGQLSWANCPVAQDCCEGAETCCTAVRPSCLGVPGDKHCCRDGDVFCPIGDGSHPVGPAPVGLRPPKGAIPTRDLSDSLPGSAAPQCCAGECLSQHYTDESGQDAEEYYCCTAPSCRGWSDDETMGPESVAVAVTLLLLLGAAIFYKSKSVRTALFGTACDRSSVQTTDADVSNFEGLEMAQAVECPQVLQDTQPVAVTGIAVGYTPPVVQAVADGDEL
eukprot:COSAG02_NODE_2305_length_9181_cov_3.277001_5_plen_393_part_00